VAASLRHSNGLWRKDAATTYPLKQGTARIKYNLDTGGTWSQPDATADGNFVAMWVYGTNSRTEPVIAILGQRQDTNVGASKVNNLVSNLDLGAFPFAEKRILYRLIFETDSTFANTPKARLAHVQDLRERVEDPANEYNLSFTEYDEDETVFQTTSQTYVQAFRLTTASLEEGDYLIFYNYAFALTANNKDLDVRVQVDDVTTLSENTLRPTIADFYFPTSGFKALNLSAGVHTVDIDLRIVQGGNTASLKEKRITFFKIP